MKIVLNDLGYVESYAIVGDLHPSIECKDDTIDLEHFETNYESYKWNGDTKSLVYDNEKYLILLDEQYANNIRIRRERECFPIINRGALWYDRLSEEQRVELNEWYQAWLDATETRNIPNMISWI